MVGNKLLMIEAFLWIEVKKSNHVILKNVIYRNVTS